MGGTWEYMGKESFGNEKNIVREGWETELNITGK
jgi:hypothetical protein